MDGREIFITRVHVFYRELAFSNLVFSWVLLFVSPEVCSPRGVLRILFSYYSSNHHFCYVLSVPEFYFKIVLVFLFCIRLLICPCAITTNLFEEFFFIIFKSLFCLYCLTLSRNLVSPISSDLFLLAEIFSFWWVPVRFIFFCNFACCHRFFICLSILNSYPGFVYLFGLLWGMSILSPTIFNYNNFTLCVFFTPSLTDDISPETEW